MKYVMLSRRNDYEPPNAAEPTHAQPGSWRKLQAMAKRYRDGQPLHHPDDEALAELTTRKSLANLLKQARLRAKRIKWIGN